MAIPETITVDIYSQGKSCRLISNMDTQRLSSWANPRVCRMCLAEKWKRLVKILIHGQRQASNVKIMLNPIIMVKVC